MGPCDNWLYVDYVRYTMCALQRIVQCTHNLCKHGATHIIYCEEKNSRESRTGVHREWERLIFIEKYDVDWLFRWLLFVSSGEWMADAHNESNTFYDVRVARITYIGLRTYKRQLIPNNLRTPWAMKKKRARASLHWLSCTRFAE